MFLERLDLDAEREPTVSSLPDRETMPMFAITLEAT